MELNVESALAAIDGFDAERLGFAFDGGKLKKDADGIGGGAVAVLEFTEHLFDVRGAGDVGDSFVGAKALMFVGDVGGRDADIEAEVESGVDLGDDLLAAQFMHGFFEEADVHIEADGGDVAVLLAAQDVAGSAEFEIEGGDFEASAEVAEFFQSGEALAGDFAEFGVCGNEEIGVGAAVGAADAATELIQLREAVAFGVLDDHGVGERDVEAVLDDGGADKHVEFVLHEAEEDTFEFRFAHLAMADADAAIGEHFADHGGAHHDRVDAVVDEVDLAAAA